MTAKPFPELSDREREVLSLMAGGPPNVAIVKARNAGLGVERGP